MKYFYDTEFKEDGKTIDLISIGVLAEDGREYYAVSNEFNTYRVANDSWLMGNVMTSIGYEIIPTSGREYPNTIKITDENAKSRWQIAQDLKAFILPDKKPRFWAWYGAYDHVVLSQLWGRMLDIPEGMPMWTNDIMTLQDLAGGIRAPKQPSGAHNALADARHNKVRYDFYMDLLKS